MYRLAWLFLTAACASAANLGVFETAADIGLNPKSGHTEFNPATGEYTVTGGTELDAAYADAVIHGDGQTSIQYRPTSGGISVDQHLPASADRTGPVRLRIERHGNRYTVSAGRPGAQLQALPQVAVGLRNPVPVGLALYPHDANMLETASFSNVAVEQAPVRPAPPRYSSKISVFDLRDRSIRTVYEEGVVYEAPNWTADGKFLISNSGGKLYRIPADGSGKPELISTDPSLRLNNDHGPSPDGKLLAFSAVSPASAKSQVYIANADGSKPRVVESAAPSYFHGWSPDGKYVAYVLQHPGPGAGKPNYDIFRAPASGGKAEQLDSDPGYDDGPDYSPDGKWIYFNSDRSGGWNIWRIPANGAGPHDAAARRITAGEMEDWFPHPSPDGKWLLIFSFPKGTTGHNDRMPGVQLRLMPLPGKRPPKSPKLEVLSTFFGGQGSINVNSWAPDSRRFAFVIYTPLP